MLVGELARTAAEDAAPRLRYTAGWGHSSLVMWPPNAADERYLACSESNDSITVRAEQTTADPAGSPQSLARGPALDPQRRTGHEQPMPTASHRSGITISDRQQRRPRRRMARSVFRRVPVLGVWLRADLVFW